MNLQSGPIKVYAPNLKVYIPELKVYVPDLKVYVPRLEVYILKLKFYLQGKCRPECPDNELWVKNPYSNAMQPSEKQRQRTNAEYGFRKLPPRTPNRKKKTWKIRRQKTVFFHINRRRWRAFFF